MNINDMKAKVLLLADPNSGYTQADFEKEFNSTPSHEFKIDVGFINSSDNPDPEYATSGSSGFDLRAFLNESITIEPGEFKLIPTGLQFEIPDNMEITIRSRSGLAYKHGVAVLNGIGTIDSDYRGEIGVLLINHGKEYFTIQHGDRIAQAVISNVLAKNIISLISVKEISETERNHGGFGSTGLK